MRIICDGDCTNMNTLQHNDFRVGSVQHIQASYGRLRTYLEKTTLLLDDPQDLTCHVCGVQIYPDHELIAVCPQVTCSCTNHVVCLSKKFLDEAAEEDQFIPIQGSCPACKQNIQWPLMMQELSFRDRGGKELQAMLKKKKGSKHGHKNNSVPNSDKPRINADNDAQQKDGLPLPGTEEKAAWGHASDVELDDDWTENVDLESDSDTVHWEKVPTRKPISQLPIVIEDSEDDMEVLE